MKVIITGSTGFIGQNLINKISKKNWEIICLVRNIKKSQISKYQQLNIKFLKIDIHSKKCDIFKKIKNVDILIHLAWTGLPNYQQSFHVNKNLPNDKRFLTNAIKSGIKHIIISGTCFEYGMIEGELDEKMNTKPATNYGLAKDLLRKFIEKKQLKYHFTYQWLRIFYVYGHKQNPKSLFPSLKKSISQKHKFFNIAKGKIYRDFIEINTVTKFIVYLCENKNFNGIINCCSGQPLSIRDFVKLYIKKRNSNLRIKTGDFKKPDYEPQNFWGSSAKMESSSFKFKNKFF